MKTFLAVCSLAALSGCANPFLENYSGTRFPATDHAVILMEAPKTNRRSAEVRSSPRKFSGTTKPARPPKKLARPQWFGPKAI